VVNATLRPLYLRERPVMHCTGGWVGLRVVLEMCGKSRPKTLIRSPDRPFRSWSLYRLSYTGPHSLHYDALICTVIFKKPLLHFIMVGLKTDGCQAHCVLGFVNWAPLLFIFVFANYAVKYCYPCCIFYVGTVSV